MVRWEIQGEERAKGPWHSRKTQRDRFAVPSNDDRWTAYIMPGSSEHLTECQECTGHLCKQLLISFSLSLLSFFFFPPPPLQSPSHPKTRVFFNDMMMMILNKQILHLLKHSKRGGGQWFVLAESALSLEGFLCCKANKWKGKKRGRKTESHLVWESCLQKPRQGPESNCFSYLSGPKAFQYRQPSLKVKTRTANSTIKIYWSPCVRSGRGPFCCPFAKDTTFLSKSMINYRVAGPKLQGSGYKVSKLHTWMGAESQTSHTGDWNNPTGIHQESCLGWWPIFLHFKTKLHKIVLCQTNAVQV